MTIASTTPTTGNTGPTAQTTPTPPPAYSTLSFVKYERASKEHHRVTNWFNVPDEQYGDGNITGYMAISEFAQWAKDNPEGCHWAVRGIITEIVRIEGERHEYADLDKIGAAAMFMGGIVSAVVFFAGHADFKPFFNASILRLLEFKKKEAFSAAKEKADFVVRMKAARAAKKVAKKAAKQVQQVAA